jgi:hypothetical protein
MLFGILSILVFSISLKVNFSWCSYQQASLWY